MLAQEIQVASGGANSLSVLCMISCRISYSVLLLFMLPGEKKKTQLFMMQRMSEVQGFSCIWIGIMMTGSFCLVAFGVACKIFFDVFPSKVFILQLWDEVCR